MKNFINIVLAIALFASCKNESGSFTISGKINKPAADTVYLEELSYNSPDTKVIDSAKIATDGTYKLRGSSSQQNLFIVGFKDNPAVILVNDASDIKISFDNNGFYYPDVSGSDATKELYKFIKDYRRDDSLISLTYQQMNTMDEAKMRDTVFVKKLQQQYMQQLNALSDVVRNYISTSKNPAPVCFVLDKARNVLSPDELTALAESAVKRFPNHTGLAGFKTTIAQQANPPADNTAYALLNQPAPELTMQSTNGKNISISDFKGKYVLVDFWASWCAPCRQENPNVVTAYNKFKNKNFTILGVSLDENKQAWLDAIKKDNLGWNHMSDLKQWESAAVTAYQFQGIPFNVLIDPSGKIIASGLRGDALEQKLTEVLQ